MSKENLGGVALSAHPEAENAVKELRRSGFDRKKLSIVGKDDHARHLNAGARMNSWGKRGAFRGGLRGCVLCILLLKSATAAMAAEAPVNLRSAANFAALAGTTITNVPGDGTAITGDLGVSPGTAVTGFPPGIVVGTIHAGDSVAAQAQADLTTAYNDAAGRSTAPVTVSGNLGGMTLHPGLYKSTSSLAISSGDLTLDAQGDPNAVFIFQMGSTLTTTSGRKVILSGGARSSNIFWQVGSSATFGTTSVFKGTILANISITFNTGATLHGAALARSGAVSLGANTIVGNSTPSAVRGWDRYD